jgi:hypothetical protein
MMDRSITITWAAYERLVLAEQRLTSLERELSAVRSVLMNLGPLISKVATVERELKAHALPQRERIFADRVTAVEKFQVEQTELMKRQQTETRFAFQGHVERLENIEHQLEQTQKWRRALARREKKAAANGAVQKMATAGVQKAVTKTAARKHGRRRTQHV